VFQHLLDRERDLEAARHFSDRHKVDVSGSASGFLNDSHHPSHGGMIGGCDDAELEAIHVFLTG
jgi:hypothetical protein